MRQTAILYPVFVQVALTFFLQAWMRRERIGAIRRGEVQFKDIVVAAAELAAARDADLERVPPPARGADPLLRARRVLDDHEPGGHPVRGARLAVRGCSALSTRTFTRR